MRATKIEVAKSYVRANPNTPHRTIAKIMNNDRPDLWRTVELARAAVRSVVGQNGKQNRAKRSKDCYNGDALSKLERELSSVPAGIPAELRTELTPYTIQPGERWGILNDVHIPAHSSWRLKRRSGSCVKWSKEPVVWAMRLNIRVPAGSP